MYIKEKYSIISHLESGHNGAYKWLKKHNRINEFCVDVGVGLNRNTEKPITCIETGIIYKSSRFCAATMKLSYKNISAVLCKKQKSTGGYTFKFVEDEE